jgi:predicted SAM-dependent methyltransferase
MKHSMGLLSRFSSSGKNEKRTSIDHAGFSDVISSQKIPNVIHFIFGLREDFDYKPFSFLHYLAVKSAHECNRPDAIKFYYKYEPNGEWWEKSKPYLTLIKVEPPNEIFGNKILHYAHQADIIRLDVLLKDGGIYLDMDVICLRSFKPLLKYECVMGVEENVGLCNAVILAKPNAEFLKKWYTEYRNFDPNNWNNHSVVLPLKLAQQNPGNIHIEDPYSFFWPLYSNPTLLWEIRNRRVPFLRRCKNWLEQIILNQSYCIHLWSQLWWNRYLKDLSPEYIKNTDNLFSRACIKFIETPDGKSNLAQNNKFRFLLPLLIAIYESRHYVSHICSKIHEIIRSHERSINEIIRSVESQASLVKFDLGGTDKGKDGWMTVNLLPDADVQDDILNIDNYCKDDSVDMFYMSHTYEHIPIVKLEEFMRKLLKKLKNGGMLIIIQSDIKKTLKLYEKRKIDFYCLRDIIFSSIYRRKENFNITGRDLQHHQYMWGSDEIKQELLYYGFSRVETMNAGSWSFDQASVFPFQNNEKYFSVRIPNLGIIAYK